MTERGVIHGRFQVLHNDHMKYLLAGRERCGRLVVGITNPDPSLTRDDPADPGRSNPMSNPLTYFERHSLITAALMEEGLTPADFSVVPFPVKFPELYRYYVPMDAVFFLTIYDQWGRRKLAEFRALGLRTEILWERPLEEKGLTASEVRKRMALCEPWEDLVPPAATRLMKEWEVPRRLAGLMKTGRDLPGT